MEVKQSFGLSFCLLYASGNTIMKQYTIDEIRYPDYEKIKKYLDDTFGESGVDGLYWLPVEDELLSEVQKTHTSCAPFFMALELEEDRLIGELLVRTRKRVRCDCICYADERQRNWLIQQVDAIFEKLGIIT
jgi:hypothetical protein